MLDQIVTYLIVLCAAAFFLCKLLLPVRQKTLIASALSGRQAPCAPEPETGLCGAGCSGCVLAASPGKIASQASRSGAA